MLRAILNKSSKQYPTKQQLRGHLLPISKTLQIRRTRHSGHCWRSKDKFINDVLLWAPSHERASVRQPARTYRQQLCTDTGCSLEDLTRVMNDRDIWRERERERERESLGNPCELHEIMMMMSLIQSFLRSSWKYIFHLLARIFLTFKP